VNARAIRIGRNFFIGYKNEGGQAIDVLVLHSTDIVTSGTRCVTDFCVSTPEDGAETIDVTRGTYIFDAVRILCYHTSNWAFTYTSTLSNSVTCGLGVGKTKDKKECL